MLRKYVLALSLLVPMGASAQIAPKSLESLLSLQVRQDGKYDIICTDRKREVVNQVQLILGAVCPARDVSAPTIVSLQRLQDGRFSVICNDLKRLVATAEEISGGKVCKGKEHPGTPLGAVKGRNFFKVQVTGKMIDPALRQACQAAGLNVPCNDKQNGEYSDDLCTDVGFEDGGWPMRSVSTALCNKSYPSDCPALDKVFQYMGEKWSNKSACGTVNGSYCAQGDQHSDMYALCVE